MERDKASILKTPFPEGSKNFLRYRPRYSRIQQRLQYKDMTFDSPRKKNFKINQNIPPFSKNFDSIMHLESEKNSPR